MKFVGLKEEYMQDLNYFIECADTPRGKENDSIYPNESLHLNFYLNRSKEELYNFINQYLTHEKINNDYDFYYFLKCIIKYMSGYSDSHTIIFKKNNTRFPIRFKMLNNSVFVSRCFDGKVLKKKINKINGVNIDKIVNEITNFSSCGTKGYLISNVEKVLSNKNDLLSLPCINSQCDQITFEFEDGENISFNVNEKYESVPLFPEKKNNDQCRIIDDILIFKYPSCQEKYKPDIKRIENIISTSNIKKFILDLRENNGGNSNIIEPLIDYLSSKELELFTIVDRHVFSSGRTAAIDMKRIGSIIMGEEIGTPINCFGADFTTDMFMPNTNIYFRFPMKYLYEDNGFVKEILTKDELMKHTKDFFEPKFLSIDIPIAISEDEYKNSLGDYFLKKCIESINILSAIKIK